MPVWRVWGHFMRRHMDELLEDVRSAVLRLERFPRPQGRRFRCRWCARTLAGSFSRIEEHGLACAGDILSVAMDVLDAASRQRVTARRGRRCPEE